MLHRLRFFALLLALATCLPSAALAEEGDDGDKKDAPKEQPEDPPKDAPKDEDGNNGGGPAPKEPGAEEGAPAGRGANTDESPVPVPAGMAYIQGGRVPIGTEFKRLDGLLGGRPPIVRRYFNYEYPRHHVFLQPYFIGKYEVTNAQYHRHLQDYIVTYDTASGSLANIDEIAAHLVSLSKDQQENRHQVVWSQLYFGNKKAIWEAFKDRIDEFQVKGGDGRVDEHATARKFRFEPLPRTLKLRFYSVRLPQNWTSMDPPPGELDHPVRYVNYNDVERFAEWAGMHVPTEQEWEWAARGPGGPYFPWGNDWQQTEVYANWGGKITNRAFETTTIPVDTRAGSNPDGAKLGPDGKPLPIDGDGRSWCGCHHMVGNVAEWTSSWFRPYPRNPNHNSFMGTYIKVIRGGTAAQPDMLALRPACRNWVGGGADAPPYPDAYFKWAGFRVAAYLKSGRDQLIPIVRRATKSKKVHEDDIDRERFVGAVTRDWVPHDAKPENHIYVQSKGHSIVIVPLKSFLREEGMDEMQKAWKRPGSLKKTNGVLKRTEELHPFWVVGVLHSDITITPVQVRKVVKEEDDDEKKSKGRRKKRRRGRARAPETQKGKCLPGTYLIGIWFGRLALLTPGKEFVCFVPLPEGQKSAFEVKKVKDEDRAPPVLAVDPVQDWAEFSFDIPLGGKGVKDEIRLRTTGRLQFDLGSLEIAGKWIQEDPAKDIAAKLLAEHVAAEKAAAEKAAKKKGKDEEQRLPGESDGEKKGKKTAGK